MWGSVPEGGGGWGSLPVQPGDRLVPGPGVEPLGRKEKAHSGCGLGKYHLEPSAWSFPGAGSVLGVLGEQPGKLQLPRGVGRRQRRHCGTPSQAGKGRRQDPGTTSLSQELCIPGIWI